MNEYTLFYVGSGGDTVFLQPALAANEEALTAHIHTEYPKLLISS